jgi:hypothetical protein
LLEEARGTRARDDADMNATATASTGVEQLDDALGGLFWGDNVVWEIEDGESLDPFVDALVAVRAQFSNAAFVTLTEEPGAIRAAHPGFDVLDARAGTQLARPGPLLTAARAFAQRRPGPSWSSIRSMR